MVRILLHLYEGLTTEHGFTCGFAFESGFNDQRDVQLLQQWLVAKNFSGWGIINFEQILFEREDDAIRFASQWPNMVE